jgi:response regulator RpfG family c-di-GMP phosphodiesterase
MKKILIVSNNEFLNLLYVINFEVYLAVNTTLAASADEAFEILKKDKYDLILSLESIDRENSAEKIGKYLKAYVLKIPLIVIGAPADVVIGKNIFGITSKFNIQEILKTSANLLEITAKQMAALDVGKYYPISIGSLLGFQKAPCQMFNHKENKYKSFVRTDDPVGDLLTSLKEQGVEQIFVKSGDRLIVTNKISLTIIEKITLALKNLDKESTEVKVQVLSNGYEFAAANLFSSNEIKQQMQEIASAASKVMAGVAKDNSNVNSLLAILTSNKDGYIFTHSMIVSYVAYHLVKNSNWGGEGQVEKINFVLFFHDIFLGPIYLRHPELKLESDLLESDKLSDNEKVIVLNHAKLGAELVVGFKRCPMGVDILIKHHHGMKKGRGFSQNYAEDLSPLSKIIVIAEMFVEELIKSKENKKSFELKIIIPELMLRFQTPSYTKIVQSLVNIPL